MMTAAPALRAGVASGDYSLSLSNLWDFTGTYSADVDGVTFVTTVSVSPSGKISGSGTASGTYDYVYKGNTYPVGVTADITSISGTVSGSGSTVRANLTKLTLKGTGTVETIYDLTNLMATASETLELDTNTLALVGSAKASFSATASNPPKPSLKHVSFSISDKDITTDLPAGATGLWTLTLNDVAVTNKTKYVGGGTLVTSNASDTNTVPLTLTGSFNTKTELSTFALKGQGADSAVSVSLTGEATTNTLGGNALILKSLTAKAFGQTVKVTAP